MTRPDRAMTAAWTDAVQRSIATMRAHLGDDLHLEALARSVWLSPFHFHRVFQRITDTTPARFLTAARIAEAKRLLAAGSDSVTDICMRIGYASLGTFTSQFARMVGVSPGRFRRAAGDLAGVPLRAALRQPPDRQPAQVTITVAGGPAGGATVVVGLFASNIPQGRPAACAVAETPATVRLGGLPDGVYYPMALAFDETVTATDAMVATDPDGRWQVAAAPAPIRIGGDGGAPHEVELRLRPHRSTDPPVVVAVPLLADAAAGVSR